ncbi:capsid maturation protease and ADP-ribosyltransferase [Mycobacterium phage Tierra]|nr:capsid maturation protease and ADP-ribosyltransferase [Mycobacterium phage Tierra]
MATAVTEFQGVLNELAGSVGRAVDMFVPRLAEATRREGLALITDAYPVLADPFLAAAADLSTQWYAEQPGGAEAFTPEPAALPDPSQLAANGRWALLQSDPLRALRGTATRAVFDSSRRTVLDNAEREGARWVRHASANACGYCRMLATRVLTMDRRTAPGPYRSEASATQAPHRRDAKGHDHCKCLAVPLRENGADYAAPAYVHDWLTDYEAVSRDSDGVLRSPNVIARAMESRGAERDRLVANPALREVRASAAAWRSHLSDSSASAIADRRSALLETVTRRLENTGVDAARYRQASVDALDALTAPDGDASLVVRTDRLAEVLAGGRFKSQHETGTGAGGQNIEARADLEAAWFGEPGVEDEPPIYGAYEVAGVDDGGAITGYGKQAVYLKPTVRERTTVTLGDSMDQQRYVFPGGSGGPDDGLFAANAVRYLPGELTGDRDADATQVVAAIRRYLGDGDYLEAQIHGGVTVSDIEHVVFDEAPSPEETQKLDALGITWRDASTNVDDAIADILGTAKPKRQRKPKRTLDDIEREMSAAIEVGDDDLVDRLVDEMERIEARENAAAAKAAAKEAEKLAADQVKIDRMLELIEQGWDEVEAESEVYGGSVESIRKRNFMAQARADGHTGKSFEELLYWRFQEMVAEQYWAAEAATNGYMIKRPYVSKFDARKLWSVNETTARKYMSEEMAGWFDQHGRVTRASLREAVLAGRGWQQSALVGDFLQ